MSLRIVNIIASTRVKGSIDIEDLSQKLQHVEYNPEIFPGLVYRRPSKPTTIMFSTGKISSHGAKSEEEAKQAILQVLNEIDSLGDLMDGAEIEKIKIENVVGIASIGHRIDLEAFAEKYGNAVYKPEQFSGVIHRPFNSSVVCLLFSSGKLVFVGGKSENQIKQAFKNVKTALRTLEKTKLKPH